MSKLQITSRAAHALILILLVSSCASNPTPRRTAQDTPTPLTAEELFLSAAAGRPTRIRQILDAKPELVNVTNVNWGTPMKLAADPSQRSGLPTYNGIPVATAALFSDCVRVLLEHGADVRATDSQGLTPLHYVALYPTVSKSERRKFTQNGEPFADIVDRVQVESMKLILEKKPDINARNHEGQTPLHYASRKGHIELVRLLVASGADRTIRMNEGGKTALDLAREAGHDEIVQLLETTVVGAPALSTVVAKEPASGVKEPVSRLAEGHAFNTKGFCAKCGWSKEFLTKSGRACTK